MWLGAPQTTPGWRGEEMRWYFRNPRRTGPPVKMPWAGAVVAQGVALEPSEGEQAEALHLSSAPRPPPGGAGRWALVCRRPGHHLPWLGEGQRGPGNG